MTGLATIAVFLSAVTAAAEEPRVVTMVVVSERPDIKPFADDLSRATGAALVRTDVTFLPPPDRALSEVQLALGCARLDESCAAAMGESVGAATVAVVTISEEPAPSVVYSLVDSSTRKRVSVRAVGVARFDMIGAQQVATALAADLGAPGKLEVHSKPPGAKVQIDGESLGSAPVAVSETLAEGQHSVTVTFANDQAIEQRLQFRRGDEIQVEATQVGAGPIGGELSTIVGWSLIGTSVAAALGGSIFGVMAVAAQDRYDAEQVMRGMSIQQVGRAEAKSLADDIQANVIGAEICFGLSLASALGAALVFAVADD